ncbi:MAG: TonB-dependent receptor, partial [Rhodothermales bacterium]|nr:TonB-dependent receptor [Rhodothermales bacterium]
AGVSTAGGVQENALVVRGNAPKGVLWRLEGVEIPNPNHFAGLSVAGGGGLTLFSSHLLADSDFFTGAFPAAYGNALAGVFDVRFRNGNPARREHTAQVGLMGIDLASEGPFVPGRAATYLFNYRYSTLGLLMPLLPTEGFITYQDIAFKVALPTRRAGRFEVWGLGGWDRQRKPETEDPAEWEYDFWDRTRMDLDLGVGAAGVSHHLLLGPQTYLHSTAALTAQHTALDHDRLDDAAALRPNLALRSTTGRAVLGTTLRHKFGAWHVHETGLAVQQLFYDLDLQAAPDDAPPLMPVAVEDGSTTLLQLYSQSRFHPSPRLTLTLGAHAQVFALTEAAVLEPRGSLRWAFSYADALTLGYGLHSQVEDLRVYFARPDGHATPNRELGLTRAHHLVLGYDRRLGSAARLKLEGYVQRLFDVPVVPDSSFSLLNFEQDWTFAEALTNDGAGRNYGVELTLERFLRDGYYVLLTGSLFRSEYRGGDGVWRRTRFDQGYAANVLAGREFSLRDGRHLLGINGRAVAVGGKRRSPVDVAASEAREEVVFDEAHAFAERKPATVLLDLTVTLRTNRRRFSDVWALQVKNVLAASDVTLDYNYAVGTVEEVREGFPLPVLSYKVEF